MGLCFPDACAQTWTSAQCCPPTQQEGHRSPGCSQPRVGGEMGAGAVRTQLAEWDSAARRPCPDNALPPGRTHPFSEPSRGLALGLYLNAPIPPQWTGRWVCSPLSRTRISPRWNLLRVWTCVTQRVKGRAMLVRTWGHTGVCVAT